MHPGGTLNFYDIFFWKTPVLGLGLGVDVTFALDNKNNHSHNDNYPHLILWEWTPGIRVRGSIYSQEHPKHNLDTEFFWTHNIFGAFHWRRGIRSLGNLFQNLLTQFFFRTKSLLDHKDFCQTPALGLGLGVDFTFTWDNKNNHNHNNSDSPHLNFLKVAVLGAKGNKG